MILNFKYWIRLKQEFLLGLFTSLFICPIAHSQSYNFSITNYPPSSYESDEYPTTPDNYDMIQDDNGLIYVANGSGLLVFDGVRWNKVQGIDNLRYGHFSKDENGTIWIASNNHVGMLEKTASANLRYKSFDTLFKKYSSSPYVLKTICFKRNVYFMSWSIIYRWNGKSLDTISSPLKVRSQFQDGWKLGDSLFFYVRALKDSAAHGTNWQITDNSHCALFTMSNDTLRSTSSFHTDQYHLIAHLATGTTENSIQNFYFVDMKGRLCHSIHGYIEELHEDSILKNKVGCIVLPSRELILATLNEGIIITDSLGSVKSILNLVAGLIDNHIHKICLDKKGGLWALTENGISRIEYPTQTITIDSKQGLLGEAYSLIIDSLKMLVATSRGVFTFSLDQTGKKPWWNRNILALGEKIMSIYKAGNGYYPTTGDIGMRMFLLNSTGHGIAYFSEPAYAISSSPFDKSIFYGTRLSLLVVYRFRSTSSESFQGDLDSIRAIVLPKPDTIRTLSENSDHKLWFSHHYVGYIDFSDDTSLHSSVTYIDSARGVEMNHHLTYKVHCINGNVYLTSHRGIDKFNSQEKRFDPDSSFGNIFGAGKHTVIDIAIDSTSNYWIASESTVGKVVNQDGKIMWDTTAFSCIPFHAHVNSIYVDYRNEVWVATDRGVFGFDQNLPFDFHYPFKTLIRKFKINNDSTVYFGYASDVSKVLGDIVIPFGMRSIAVDYAATDFTNPKKLLYSYLLEGRDHTWSGWSKETSRNFDGLPEGNYIFRVKSKNLYGTESSVASYKFTILPPWYRTWWAYLSYFLIAGIIVYLIVRLNQRRLIAEKKNLEKLVGDRTRELKDTQVQLVQSEKMASLGQLTAGVAHEINNPINFVSANITPLKRDIDEIMHLLEVYSSMDQSNYAVKLNEILKYRNQIDLNFTITEIKSLLKGIEEGSNRTAEIVKGLRNFSRLDEEEMKETNIHEGIESTLLLLNNKLNQKHIEVIKSFSTLPNIKCYPGQLNQVFMNVITNAMDAIGQDGRIFITTSTENNHVKISIGDTGQGMSEEVKQKIFDPFFTTKGVGKGTGLGLSISYGIIEKHDGKIEVKSEVGKGTEFIIKLPLHS